MEESLSKLSTLGQRDRITSYESLISSSSPKDLILLLDALLSDPSGPIVSRQVLPSYAARVAAIEDVEIKRATLKGSLDRMEGMMGTYEEQIAGFRYQMADILENEEEWKQAALMLQAVPMDSGHRTLTDSFRLSHYVRLMRLYLEDDDPTSAEPFAARAAGLVHSVSSSPEPADKANVMAFRLCQARINDANRRFLDAGQGYWRLSMEGELEEEERANALSAAHTCAILSPAGPSRSRLLSVLHSDSRSPTLPHYSVLSSIFLDRLLPSSQVSSFASTLAPHQLALLPPSSSSLALSTSSEPLPPGIKHGPETVLDRAVIEHNLLAASRLYSTITFGGLGALLGLTEDAAEQMARTMVQQGRLRASMDQVERVVRFEAGEKDGEEVVSNVAGGKEGEAEGEEERDDVMKWAPGMAWRDVGVKRTLREVERVAERLEALVQVGVGA